MQKNSMKKFKNFFRWPVHAFEYAYISFWGLTTFAGIVDLFESASLVSAFVVGFNAATLLWTLVLMTVDYKLYTADLSKVVHDDEE